jgi:AGZA family xanthine/uracil permease-like MFS transporter
MHGVISLQQGFIFTSMILAAIGVALIERRFRTASLWSLAAALLSAVGIIHAYELTPGGIANRFGFLAAPEFFVGYLLLALLFFAVALYAKQR